MGTGKIKSMGAISTSGSGWSSMKITLDDGREGEILIGQNKTDHPYKEGMEITFEEEMSQWGLKFKKAKPVGSFTPGGGGGGKRINEAAISANVALAEAVKLVIAGKVDVAQTLPMADKLFIWIKEKGGF